MKILHLATEDLPPGALELMRGLKETGARQIVAAPARLARELAAADLRHDAHILQTRFRFLRRLRLRRLMRRERPDIVQCWGAADARLLPGRARARYAAFCNPARDPADFAPCANFAAATPPVAARLKKRGVKNAEFLPLPPASAAVPPLDRAALSTPREAKVLLSLSRLHPDKGLDTLLAAAAEMPETVVWLAGTGPLRRSLENDARRLGMLERVRFLGARADRAALLRAADICVIPARRESSPAFLLEAWAAGTPAVVSDPVAALAAAQSGVNALVAAPNDAQALAAALRRVLREEHLRRALVAQGYAAYVKNYAREAAAARWLRFYQAL